MEAPIRADGDGVRIAIQLAPKSSRDKVLGLHNQALKIAITAPPIDGRANRHLIKFLAKQLKVAPREITFISGELARLKVLRIAGVTVAQATAVLLP